MLQLRNTLERYGSINILFHWVIASIIIFQIIVGLYATELPVSPIKLKLFRLHKEWGFTLLFLTLLRLAWRITNPLPDLSSLPAWERISARFVHWMFYILLILLPITGWLTSSAAGIPISYFGLFTFPDLVPANESLRTAFATAHEVFAYSFIAFLTLHIAAALKHHFIDKDTILRRMLWF